MALITRQISIDGVEAIELKSSLDDATAIKEMEAWCRSHSCTRSGENFLRVVVENDVTYRIGLAYPVASTAIQGEDIYSHKVVSHLRSNDVGRIVAIDCNSGDYAIRNNEVEALDALIDMHSDARAYLKRVGYTALAGIGAIVPKSNNL